MPEKNKKNEEVGGGSQGEVVMEFAPRSSLKVIETEVILVALEVLFDLEALTAQAQRRDAFRRSIEPGGVNMVRFGLACGQSKTNQVSGISLESSARSETIHARIQAILVENVLPPAPLHRQGCQAESGRLRPISNTVWACGPRNLGTQRLRARRRCGRSTQALSADST